MKHAYKYLNFLLLLTLIAFGVSCSSSGGDDDDDDDVSGIVPANAVLINSSPVAEITATSAIVTGLTVTLFTGIEASSPITAKDIIDAIMDKININRQNSISVVTGADLSLDYCPTNGTATGEEIDTATTYHLDVDFVNCQDESFTIDGNLLVDDTSTANDDGPYTEDISGSLTITGLTVPGTSTSSFTLSNFDLRTNGDDSNGEFTVTSFDFTFDTDSGGGYVVRLTQNLVGNELNSPCEVTGGQILITGAADSQARLTINSDGTMTIEYHNGDGDFIETDNSPILCLF